MINLAILTEENPLWFPNWYTLELPPWYSKLFRQYCIQGSCWGKDRWKRGSSETELLRSPPGNTWDIKHSSRGSPAAEHSWHWRSMLFWSESIMLSSPVPTWPQQYFNNSEIQCGSLSAWSETPVANALCPRDWVIWIVISTSQDSRLTWQFWRLSDGDSWPCNCGGYSEYR